MLDDVLSTAVLLGDVDSALAYYNDWKVSDRVRFPFAGGRLEQPVWVLHNLNTLALMQEYHELSRELEMSEEGGDEWGSAEA